MYYNNSVNINKGIIDNIMMLISRKESYAI